jgi:tetratricopeptide (TPR) repeat protein
MALIFLIYKCMYAVVIPSVIGGFLMVYFFARLSRESKEIVTVPHYVKGGIVVFGSIILVWSIIFVFSDNFSKKGYKELIKGNLVAAEQQFSTALKIHPNHSMSQLGMAYVFFSKQEFVLMGGYIEEALNSEASINVIKPSAALYLRSGDLASANALYYKIHRAYPEHLTPLAKMAEIAIQQGNDELATHLAKKILAINPRIKSTSYEINRQFARQILTHKL